MKFFGTLLSLLIMVSTAQADSTLILEGRIEDPQSIQMTRRGDQFSFSLCENNKGCKILGKSTYSLCEMKEYVSEPIWAIFLGGEASFSLASVSWGGFVKALIWNPQEGTRKIRVTDLMFQKQADKTQVTIEAEKIEKTLSMIGEKCLEKN